MQHGATRKRDRVTRWLLCLLLLSLPLRAQEPPAISSTGGVAERAFPFRVLPIALTVQRGEQSLPISRVPELRVGDVIRLKVDLDAPELNSLNDEEKRRLRDWSIGWFLTTPEGSLVFDSTARDKTDRGRIDLERGEGEITIHVEHERQKFPIFFFVRTRTLESWDEIRQTREIKASNFVDHFGRYSDVVTDYASLQTFLTSLQREAPQAETLDDRLSAGFGQLGFTVDSKMRLGDPEVVAKLLGELETSLGKQSNTFKAEAAGKLLSQMIGDSDLGLIGAAVSIGGFFYRATDYSESYHWSSARLQETPDGKAWVMSAERIRYGEDEQAPDGNARKNVRSILVCTPMPTTAARRPTLAWKSDGAGSLVPGEGQPRPELRLAGDQLVTRTHPALVERAVSPNGKVWDSVHGDSSPLTATVGNDGTLTLKGLQSLWDKGDLSAQVRVQGQWGFEPLPLVEFTALKGGAELSAAGAPFLLSQSQRYRLQLESPSPVAIGHARFAGREVKVEREGGRPYLSLDPGRVTPGKTRLEVYAGQGPDPANLLLSKDFYVASGSNFHVLWPRGSHRCELVCREAELEPVLSKVTAIRLGGATFERQPGSAIFVTPKAPEAAAQAELLFSDSALGTVPSVHVETPTPHRRADLQIYPLGRDAGQAYVLDLDPSKSHLLANQARAEFRLRGGEPWPDGSKLVLELVGPGGQVAAQPFSAQPASGEERLRLKGELLFGDFTPRATGKLRCRLSTPISGSALPLEWTLETDWQVVDVPTLRRVSFEEGFVTLEGTDLDITIARVYASESDPQGAELVRQADGSYRAGLTDLDPNTFWLELADAPGQRFRLSR